MSRHTTLLLFGMVALTAIAMSVAVRVAGLRLHVADLLQPGLVCLGLSASAWWYRKIPSFYLCLNSLSTLVAFSTMFVIFTYALAASRWPLADAGLARLDAWFGINAKAIADGMNAIPWLHTLMWYAYFSILPQTMLAIMVLGLRNSEKLGRFLLQFMLCAWITAACFYVVPALGTCGASPPDYLEKTVRDTLALRNGTAPLVTWRAAEGLITFPSFHVIWGVLIAIAFRSWPITLLNVLMIVSTIPIGKHYATDLVGGFLVCAFVVPLANRLFDTVNRPAQWPLPMRSPVAG